MLREINFENVKGQTAVQPLTGKDIFVGRNGSGKTTRVQATGLAMLGYVPGQGKTAAETFKLATGEAMTVGLKTDSFQFTRTFTRHERTDRKTGAVTMTIKETISVYPGQGERTETQKKERIASEIGNFPVMLDFNEFLSLSDTKRRDFIYSLSPISSDSWDKERVRDYLIANLLTPELEMNNPEQYEVMKNSIDETLEQFPEGFSIHDGLQSMLDYVSAQLSYWNSKKKDAQGAVRQLAEMKNQIAETDRNIAEHKKELEELQQQLIDVEKKIAADEQKKKNIDRRFTRIEELKKEIATVEAEPVNTDITELEKQIIELRSSLPEPIETDEKIANLNKLITEAQAELDQLNNDKLALQEQKMSIHSTVKTLQEALTKVNELGGACVLHQMIACPKDFTGLDGYVEQQKQKADEALAKLNEQLNQIEKEINSFKEAIAVKEYQKTTIFKEAQAVQSKRGKILDQIRSLEKEMDIRKTAGERKENRLTMLREELAKLINEKDEPIGDISMMQAQANGLKNRITELKASVDEKEKSKQTILLMQQSMIDNRQAEHKADSFKSINEMLGPKGVQGELVKEILEPIKRDIQANLQLMGFDNEPFFQTESDTGKEIFQFGWINDKGHQVNFDALSTGQQTVYLAAMMMTIIDLAQPKLRLLIMDNLNHLDKQNFQLLIDGLTKIADKLDNIILAGAVEYEFQADGWNVVNLTPVAKGGAIHEQYIA